MFMRIEPCHENESEPISADTGEKSSVSRLSSKAPEKGCVSTRIQDAKKECPTPTRHASGPTIFFSALFLAALLVSPTTLLPQPAGAQTIPAIETQGGVWADPTVSIVIAPATGEAWYRESYAADAAYAVQRWAHSFIVFTDNHGYNYLRKLTFQIYTTGINATPANPDVEISFIQNFPPTGTPALGVTQAKITISSNHFENVSMTLAAQDPDRLRQLTDNDMVNIATHEFGHALGLGHANTHTTDDNFLELMATSYNLPVGNPNNQLEAPSTLDLYALATIYTWLANSETLTGPGPEPGVTTLPSSVAYTVVYPYPEQIEAYRVSLDQANQRIIILALLTIILLAITLTLGVLLARRRPTPPLMFPPSIPPEPAPTVGQPG